MIKVLFDSNILIDYLNGISAAKKEFQLYESRAISVVTWMEVMVGGEIENDALTRGFLASFDIIPVSQNITERAVQLRREREMKLPDAIILASAIEHGLLLVTRNIKDFDATLPSVRVPYSVR
jgi:predicted nucleic acid-binding protein